jgi:CBS domain-containing protein
MGQALRDVMTRNPATMDSSTTIVEAAALMRDRDIGNVLVSEEVAIRGIVTDRDLVVRVLADGRDAAATRLADVASNEIVSLPPTATVEEAVDLMMKRALRRIPVIKHDRPIGIVAIGDLAVHRDPKSALGKISGADPNR